MQIWNFIVYSQDDGRVASVRSFSTYEAARDAGLKLLSEIYGEEHTLSDSFDAELSEQQIFICETTLENDKYEFFGYLMDKKNSTHICDEYIYDVKCTYDVKNILRTHVK